MGARLKPGATAEAGDAAERDAGVCSGYERGELKR
jgi:hypothetical protein